MPTTLSAVSAEAKLKAINVLISVFEKWIPKEQHLTVHLDRICGDDRETFAVCLSALRTFAQEQDESYKDWWEYERDGEWPREPVPGLALLVVKVLSRPAA